jgi:hypothetical protein
MKFTMSDDIPIHDISQGLSKGVFYGMQFPPKPPKRKMQLLLEDLERSVKEIEEKKQSEKTS